MKKLLLTMAALLMLTACEKQEMCEEALPAKKTVTFRMDFDFKTTPFTRGSLTSNENTFTDLWVFDFVGDDCLQSVHQSNTDSDWGNPELILDYGSHSIYFVASKGKEFTLDESAKIIVWSKPNDTFWCKCDLEVSNGSSENISVTLDRVVSKLKITVNDEVPEGLSTLSIIPATWYCGIDYTTGNPSSAVTSQARTVSVPSSYAGTTGTLSMSIYGFSSADEWTTDIEVDAKNGDNEIVGHASIEDAPLKRNRSTEYSGKLFCNSRGFSISINDEWNDAYNSEW